MGADCPGLRAPPAAAQRERGRTASVAVQVVLCTAPPPPHPPPPAPAYTEHQRTWLPCRSHAAPSRSLVPSSGSSDCAAAQLWHPLHVHGPQARHQRRHQAAAPPCRRVGRCALRERHAAVLTSGPQAAPAGCARPTGAVCTEQRKEPTSESLCPAAKACSGMGGGCWAAHCCWCCSCSLALASSEPAQCNDLDWWCCACLQASAYELGSSMTPGTPCTCNGLCIPCPSATRHVPQGRKNTTCRFHRGGWVGSSARYWPPGWPLLCWPPGCSGADVQPAWTTPGVRADNLGVVLRPGRTALGRRCAAACSARTGLARVGTNRCGHLGAKLHWHAPVVQEQKGFGAGRLPAVGVGGRGCQTALAGMASGHHARCSARGAACWGWDRAQIKVCLCSWSVWGVQLWAAHLVAAAGQSSALPGLAPSLWAHAYQALPALFALQACFACNAAQQQACSWASLNVSSASEGTCRPRACAHTPLAWRCSPGAPLVLLARTAPLQGLHSRSGQGHCSRKPRLRSPQHPVCVRRPAAATSQA